MRPARDEIGGKKAAAGRRRRAVETFGIDEAARRMGVSRRSFALAIKRFPFYAMDGKNKLFTGADVYHIRSAQISDWVDGANKAKAKADAKASLVRESPCRLYFIRSGDFLKIGITKNLEQRLADIRTQAPHGIDLLHMTLGGRAEESALHRRFAQLRHNGEWFRYEGELVEYVEALRCAKEA